jgi:hypothetical protein
MDDRAAHPLLMAQVSRSGPRPRCVASCQRDGPRREMSTNWKDDMWAREDCEVILHCFKRYDTSAQRRSGFAVTTEVMSGVRARRRNTGGRPVRQRVKRVRNIPTFFNSRADPRARQDRTIGTRGFALHRRRKPTYIATHMGLQGWAVGGLVVPRAVANISGPAFFRSKFHAEPLGVTRFSSDRQNICK